MIRERTALRRATRRDVYSAVNFRRLRHCQSHAKLVAGTAVE